MQPIRIIRFIHIQPHTNSLSRSLSASIAQRHVYGLLIGLRDLKSNNRIREENVQQNKLKIEKKECEQKIDLDFSFWPVIR